MSNYNLTLQSNNTDLQAILNTINGLPEAGGEQATPVISVSPTNGLITATAGNKSSTHQLAFQPAKTITPSTASQIAVSSGYYTGGNITVAAVSTQTKSVTPKATSQNVTPDSGKFLSKVTVNGDSNLVAENIKSGVSIFGVSGTLAEGSGNGYDEADSLIVMTISSYTNSRVTSIGIGAFAFAVNLQSVNFNNALLIGRNAFYSCEKLTTVSFPACKTIGKNAFNYCSSLTTANFPACTTIESGTATDGAFYHCGKLTTANFPACTMIGRIAFYYCGKLTTVSFPACKTIGNNAFGQCGSLTTANFPACTTIESGTVADGAFYHCGKLTTANFPACTMIGKNAFYLCSSLTSVSFPVATNIDSYAFYYCSSLTIASFPAATTIGSYAFQYCYNLKSLYLTGSSLCTLSNSNAFSSTPIGGYSTSAGTYGSIYVPGSLLTQYQTATNWTYFSSRIAAYVPFNFTILNAMSPVPLEAYPGMTWGEWVESNCNSNNYYVTSTGNIGWENTYLVYHDEAGSIAVTADEFVEQHNYYLIELKD